MNQKLKNIVKENIAHGMALQGQVTNDRSLTKSIKGKRKENVKVKLKTGKSSLNSGKWHFILS